MTLVVGITGKVLFLRDWGRRRMTAVILRMTLMDLIVGIRVDVL